jgi:hypothetical protein
MKPIKIVSVMIIIVVLLSFGQENVAADGNWFVSLYGGQGTDGSEKDVFTFKADYVDSYMLAFVTGKELLTWKDYIRIEAEGHIVKHFKLQDHFEFNALFVFRWLPFPWDNYLDTSFAIGDGISYATKDPEIEIQKHEETSKILNFLMFELAVTVPRHPHWSVFTRFHHRSGMFGLINGMSGGSNFVGIGIKYTF